MGGWRGGAEFSLNAERRNLVQLTELKIPNESRPPWWTVMVNNSDLFISE